MAQPTVVWRHYSGTLGSDGTAWVQSGNNSGTFAQAGGAFVTAGSSSDTDTVWTGTRGQAVDVVGSYMEHDGSTSTYIIFGFKGTPGASFRAHIWVTTA